MSILTKLLHLLCRAEEWLETELRRLEKLMNL